jgi:hypothetical protein
MPAFSLNITEVFLRIKHDGVVSSDKYADGYQTSVNFSDIMPTFTVISLQ